MIKISFVLEAAWNLWTFLGEFSRTYLVTLDGTKTIVRQESHVPMKIGATKKTRKKTTSKVSKVKNKNISKLFEFWKHHQLFVYTYLTSCTSWTSSSTDFKESCEHWDENMVCNLLFSFWRLITTFSISWSRSSISNLSNFNLEKSSSNHMYPILWIWQFSKSFDLPIQK